jgi:hypothetical protein
MQLLVSSKAACSGSAPLVNCLSLLRSPWTRPLPRVTLGPVVFLESQTQQLGLSKGKY